jgi:hypothetical protein
MIYSPDNLKYFAKFKAKVRQGGNELVTKAVHKARLGTSEDANAVSPTI